jgi:excinuclease UvrABC nuclease subunit
VPTCLTLVPEIRNRLASKDDSTFDGVASRLRSNYEEIKRAPQVPFSEAKLFYEPGVYIIYFDGALQYIGSSGSLKERIRSNLLSGDREAHTLINKLCVTRNWNEKQAKKFLKESGTIRFLHTHNAADAPILEYALIATYSPPLNGKVNSK